MTDKQLKSRTEQERFWNWFSDNSEKYLNFETDQVDLFDVLSDRLIKIDDNLTFEFSPLFDNGSREFIISAGGIKESFPAVIKLVDKAPQIPNWRIIAFRQPNLGYEQINYKDIELSFDDVYFRYSKENGKIGVELNMRGFRDEGDWAMASYLLLDMVIGEYNTEMSLSWIERKVLDEEEIDILYPIRDLPGIIEGYKREYEN